MTFIIIVGAGYVDNPAILAFQETSYPIVLIDDISTAPRDGARIFGEAYFPTRRLFRQTV